MNNVISGSPTSLTSNDRIAKRLLHLVRNDRQWAGNDNVNPVVLVKKSDILV